jgi:hypothetical protein
MSEEHIDNLMGGLGEADLLECQDQGTSLSKLKAHMIIQKSKNMIMVKTLKMLDKGE